MRDAVFAAGAGRIGDYERCSWYTEGTGTFLALEGTNPTVGEVGREERVDELRLETVFPEEAQDDVVAALRAAHPYEEPAFDIYALAVKARLTPTAAPAATPARPPTASSSRPRTATVLAAEGDAIGVGDEQRRRVPRPRRRPDAGARARGARGRGALRLRADGQADARRVPVKNEALRALDVQAARLGRGDRRGVGYVHVRREKNELADRLVNEALDAEQPA